MNSGRKFKKIKWTAAPALSLLFLLGAVQYVRVHEFRPDLRLVFSVQIPHEARFRLYVDDDKPLNAMLKPSPDFQEAVFLLPKRRIRRLKLTLGKKRGVTALRHIRLEGLIHDYRWPARQVKKLLNRKHGVAAQRIKKGALLLRVRGKDPFVTLSEDFCRLIDTAAGKKTIYYLLTLPLTLIFFYLLHFFDPRGLRMFFDRRTAINMTLVFLVILFIPLLDGLFHFLPKSQLVEKRKMARRPAFRFDTLSTFPPDYGAYYNDHFAGRGHWIYWNSFLKYALFGVSSQSKVVVGKEGWLYMGKGEARPGTSDYYRNIRPFTPAELEQWAEVLKRRKRWLADRGVAYLYVVVPNKNTIYPEFMPDNLRKAHPVSRLDQLKEHLRAHTDIPFVDLRPALSAAKKQRPVYDRTDTHWNDYGAYVGYREILKHARRYFPDLEPLPLSRFNIGTPDRAGGDLAEMLSLHLETIREEKVRLTADPPLKAKGDVLPRLSRFVRQSYRKNPDAPLPALLMVNDSFYQKLRPFLSEHFKWVRYIWDWNMGFYPALVKKDQPVLVIDEMAERFLMPRPTKDQ